MGISYRAFTTKFMTQTTSYDPYESSQTNPSEWKVRTSSYVAVSYLNVCHLQKTSLTHFCHRLLISPCVKHDLDYLLQLLDIGKISPSIGTRITLDEVPKAQENLEAGLVDGLIVCKPWN